MVGGLGSQGICLSTQGQREKVAAATEDRAQCGGYKGQGLWGAAAGEEERDGGKVRGMAVSRGTDPKCP